MRLVLLSDLHIGMHRADLVQPLLDSIAAAKADHIIVAGDLVQRASKAQFTHAADRLERLLEGTRGVRFQRKERSLAIHLRLPRNDKGRTTERIARLLRKEGLRVLYGHRILDAQLPGVDKGRAVSKWLRRHPRPDAVLYAGDDTTDEDAMLALAGRAFTVAVGPRPRCNTYRTSSTRTFAAWLARLAAAREKHQAR